MTYPQQGWWPPQPPPPPPAPRRYATGWVFFGVAVGIVTTIAIPTLGFILAGSLEQDFLGWMASMAAFLPLAVGVLLAALKGSPARKGFGLGLTIGWSLAPIIFAGACFVIVIGAYMVPGFPGGVA